MAQYSVFVLVETHIMSYQTVSDLLELLGYQQGM